MKFFDKPLTSPQLANLKKDYGNYVKLTVDIQNGWVVAGGELHADGEKILLEKGGKFDQIWGGGIDLTDKQIDAAAVLNLRPRLNNDNLEILDSKIREKFVKIVKKFFNIQ